MVTGRLSPRASQPANSRGPAPWEVAALWAGRLLVVAWAGFWIWFAVMSGASDMPRSAWPMALFVAGFAGCAVGAIVLRRWGGLVMVAAAVFSALYFPSTGAWWLLSLPAAVAGVLLMVGGWRGQPRA